LQTSFFSNYLFAFPNYLFFSLFYFYFSFSFSSSSSDAAGAYSWLKNSAFSTHSSSFKTRTD